MMTPTQQPEARRGQARKVRSSSSILLRGYAAMSCHSPSSLLLTLHSPDFPSCFIHHLPQQPDPLFRHLVPANISHSFLFF